MWGEKLQYTKKISLPWEGRHTLPRSVASLPRFGPPVEKSWLRQRVSPSQCREIFEISCIKMAFFCIRRGRWVGYMKCMAYTNSLLPVFFHLFFDYNQGEGMGDMGPCAPSYGSDSDVARICQRGAKARERSDRAGGGGGGPLSHGREIFFNFVYQNIKCHY